MRVLAKGVGATHLGGGTIDVLGYAPRARRPPAARRWPRSSPSTRRTVRARRRAAASRPRSSGSRTWSPAARSRPTPTRGRSTRTCCCRPRSACRKPSALVPSTMAGGDLRGGGRVLAVGFRGLKDFHPALLADGLRRTCRRSRRARSSCDLPAGGRADVQCARAARARSTSATSARDGDRGARVAAARRRAGGVPGGARDRGAARGLERARARLGRPVFEVPTLPPSVPGMRVFATLRERAAARRRARACSTTSSSAPSARAAA